MPSNQQIVWEDPPESARRPGTRKGGKYGQFADELRRNPGKSAKLGPFVSGESARAFANSVEHRRKAGFKEGVWEAAVDEVFVYVKYVRDSDPADTATADAETEATEVDDDGPDPDPFDTGE